MKLVRFTLLVVLLLVLVAPVGVFAQDGPTSYTVGFQVANLEAEEANIVINYYNQDGTTASPSPVADTIAANSSNTYFPVHTAEGFNGSVVISSDKQIVAIANILGDSGAFGGASYDGFSAGASSANIPLVLNDFYNISTWFNVQNTGSSDAVVTVTYVGTGGCTEAAVTIAPGAAATFDQTDSCLSAGFIGAGTVTTADPSQTVAVAVVQYDPQSLLSYNGFTTAGSTNPVMPLISHGFWNAVTALQIQNTGGTDTDVTVTYTPSTGFPGATCSETKTVPAGGSENFGNDALFRATGEPCGPMPAVGVATGSGFVGGASVTGNTTSQTLVAIVNTVTSGTPNAAAYSGFDPSMATDQVNLPLVMDRYFNIFTGFSIANVGSTPTSIVCTYSDSTVTSEAIDVPAGQALTVVNDLSGDPIGAGYVGSANCTATGGDAMIVGVVSQLGGSGDALLYYEGFGH